MDWCAYARPLLHAGLGAGLLAVAAPAALANDAHYCIVCKTPDQVYRCQVTGANVRANDAVKLYCIVRTAKEGNHSSCSAERSGGECYGTVKTYSYDGPAIPPDIAADPRVQGFADRIARDQRTFGKPQDGKAPKTLFEAGGRAASATRQGFRNARSRFGGGSQDDEPVPVTDAPPPAAYAPPPANPSPAPANAESFPPEADMQSAPLMDEEPLKANRVQRAGTAVGGFARKSYRCMASFFRKCRDDG